MDLAMTTLPLPPAALLFDLDNTLIDRDRAFTEWARTFVQVQLGGCGAAEQRAALDTLMELDARGHGSKAAMFAAIRAACPCIDAPVESLVAAFQGEMPACCTLAIGASQLLRALAAAQIPFGIVTNGSRHQLRRIQTLGLDRSTTCIFVSELVGSRKPEAAIFLAAAECLGTAPDSILFVGDTPEVDIVGAHNAGMKTGWLRHRGRPWPPHLAPAICDLTVTGLWELRDLLQGAT